MTEAVNIAVRWALHWFDFNPESRPGLDQISRPAPIFQKFFWLQGNGVGSLKKLGHARTRRGKI